jgi:hypothetical protein
VQTTPAVSSRLRHLRHERPSTSPRASKSPHRAGFSEADDGVRTRDPELGKVSPRRVRQRPQATAAAELRGFVRLGLRLRQGFQPDRRELHEPSSPGRGPRGARLRLRQLDLLPRSAGAVGDGLVILWARESVAPPGDEQTRAVGADVEGARLVIAERRAVLAFHP